MGGLLFLKIYGVNDEPKEDGLRLPAFEQTSSLSSHIYFCNFSSFITTYKRVRQILVDQQTYGHWRQNKADP